MASISISFPPPLYRNSVPCRPSSLILPFISLPTPVLPRLLALRATGTDGIRVRSHGAQDPALLRRPSPPSPEDGDSAISSDEDAVDGNPVEEEKIGSKRTKDEELVDWEDLILQDTVPLVGFVRMILHSGKYENGDRLSPEHEKTILERVLPYHPQSEKKIGCGIDFITIGFHPEFENSRCLFIVRKDGEIIDFSYWKCIKGLIRKNYPLYADGFILRHFRRRRHTD